VSTTATAGTDSVTCIPDELSLPDGPFTSLRYHFGMLLGVDDFATEQRYQRGKIRLHNAWLHRAGIVWGLGVGADLGTRELTVDPGLALDPTGRELHLDVRCCMDIGAWYDDNKDGVTLTHDDAEAGQIAFDGRVELVFCSCGTRPVPAISAPCEGAAVDTAYARTFETVSIRFVSELADPEPPPYPRLRMLFGLDDGAAAELTDAERNDIASARAEVLSSGTWSQALLQQLRAWADRDVTAMTPAAPPDGSVTVFPALDDAGVVLANVHDITLEGSTGNWKLTNATIDPTPRRVHVATQTIEELLCGDLRGGLAAGPQVSAIEIDRAAKTISISLNKPVDHTTVQNTAFSVTTLGGGGWSSIGIDAIAVNDNPSPDVAAGIDLTLKKDPAEDVLRFIAYGTGPSPILGSDHVPLAGPLGGPPGTEDDGHDYVYMSIPT
jgi:hypothetical protein